MDSWLEGNQAPVEEQLGTQCQHALDCTIFISHMPKFKPASPTKFVMGH